MEEPRIPLRELRPWLWLPLAALVFAVGLALSGLLRGMGVDAGSLAPTAVVAVVSAEVVGSAATFWRGRGVRSWGAVGAFMVLTLVAHFVVGLLAVLVAILTEGLEGAGLSGLVFTGVYFPLIMLFALGWLSLPVGGAAGLLAWTLAQRARRSRDAAAATAMAADAS